MKRQMLDTTIQGHDSYYRPYAQILKDQEPLSMDELNDMNLDDLSPRELESLTTRLLWTVRKEEKEAEEFNPDSEHNLYFSGQWGNRRRREVMNEVGTAEPTITHDTSPDRQTLYWRSHPEGRKVAKKSTGDDKGYYSY